jgi:hypothetical protein
MAKKISNKDIFEGNIFKPTTEDAERLNNEIKKLITGFGTLASTIKSALPKGEIKTFEQYKNASKDVNDIADAFKGFNKAVEEQTKLQNKLEESKTDNAKANDKLRVQISEQKKANKRQKHKRN